MPAIPPAHSGARLPIPAKLRRLRQADRPDVELKALPVHLHCQRAESSRAATISANALLLSVLCSLRAFARAYSGRPANRSARCPPTVQLVGMPTSFFA